MSHSELIGRLQGLAGPINTRIHMPMWLYDAHRAFDGEACSALADAIAGSLDAAERFRQAVLPGSILEIYAAPDAPAEVDVRISRDQIGQYAEHRSIPVAIVIATLRAKEAQSA